MALLYKIILTKLMERKNFKQKFIAFSEGKNVDVSDIERLVYRSLMQPDVVYNNDSFVPDPEYKKLIQRIERKAIENNFESTFFLSEEDIIFIKKEMKKNFS